MAVPPVEVKALWDGSQITSGTQTAAADIDRLNSAIDSASQDMTSSLSYVGDEASQQFATNIPESADAGAVGLSSRIGKYKAVGTELGTSVAQGLQSGVSGPEVAANTGSALAGVLALSAKSIGGVAGAIGLGLGVALIKGMMDGAKANAQDLRDRTNQILGGVENDFRGSMRQILQDMREELGVTNVIEGLGKGDLGAGWAELERISQVTGYNVKDLVDYLQGKGTLATKDMADEFARGRVQAEQLDEIQGDMNKKLALNYGVSKDLVAEAEKNSTAWDRAKDAAEGLNQLMGPSRENTEKASEAAARLAAGLERAANAAADLNATSSGRAWDVV